MKKLKSETKLFLSIGIGTLLIIILASFFMTQSPKPIAKEILIKSTTQTTGNKDAKTWLVEFSDFECPACKQFSENVETLRKTYPNDLLVAYRNYPLPQHPMSRKAAAAAQAAGLQGKFWEIDKLLFANQSELSDSMIASLAGTLSIDMEKYTVDSTSSAVQEFIDEDIAFGESLGISFTPTFYLNGMKLDLQSIEDLQKKVEETINKNK